ncbi:outer membrane beta-barrel protein [Chryseobacterium sp. SIMBA_029]|uniref:outer membrane beta-barrel protein n=1 Tax=Chryseobacterium sp. SIMBA_029 TaxID=3085772 RepID=UPI00397AB547
MKKLFLTGAIAFFGLASAQKNTLLVGGNIAYSSTKNTDVLNNSDTTNKFEFSPTVGYQFADHWTAGVSASFGTNKISDAYKVNTDKIGGFVRYAQPFNETFAIYGDLGIGYQGQKATQTILNQDFVSKANGMYVQFTPALFINFKNSFGLNFNIGGIGYNNLNDKNSDAKSSTFDFSFGKSVNIGISKNFGLRK